MVDTTNTLDIKLGITYVKRWSYIRHQFNIHRVNAGSVDNFIFDEICSCSSCLRGLSCFLAKGFVNISKRIWEF